jgi:hypothetical protein
MGWRALRPPTVEETVRRLSNNCPMELLDLLDQKRHDTLGILDALNDFGRLSDAEQDAYLGIWEYAGLDSAQHPLTALLRESHNETWVVRDLDGTLQLLWQESSSSDRWQRGPLWEEHLIDFLELEERLDHEPAWLEEAEISLPLTDLGRVLADLPSAEHRVMSL